MKRTCLALFFGLLTVIGLSAPPERCDDAPGAVAPLQTPFSQVGPPPRKSPSPTKEPSRRQRIQSLRDRVNQLKMNLDCPIPQPPAQTNLSPQSQPHVDLAETPSPETPRRPPLPLPVTPPALVELEPAPSPQPVEPLEPVPQTEPVPTPDATPHLAPATQPMAVSLPVSVPLPEPTPQREQAPPPEPPQSPRPQLTSEPLNSPEPTVERPPPPDSPRPLITAPAPETAIPATTESDIPPSHKESPLVLPSELLDQTIDRQRMGNNLYAVGAYELALLNYEKMLRQPLNPMESQWAQFQIANCQRQLGQVAEAQKSYRRVSGETSEEWLGQMSRWWLKELDEREQLQRRVSELDQITKALEQEFNRVP